MNLFVTIASSAFGLIVLIAIIILAYRRAFRIPAPNEALIIVGRSKEESEPVVDDSDPVKAIAQKRTEGLNFRIATSGAWVNPLSNRVFSLPLDSRSTSFEVDCHDNQKIAVNVKGVILYKVGDNYPAMRAAARRFLEMSDEELNNSISNLVTGQVRALVGEMTIPELITERQKLIDNVRAATYEDMANLGLQIDSLSIQDVSDNNKYIENLGRPQAEAVEREASIAADQARQAREQAKQAADLEIARVQRDTAIKTSEFKAEQDQALEIAGQSGPLARAQSERKVVVEQTEVAKLQTEMAEQRYNAEVRKRADADRYAIEQAAAAEKAQLVARAEAEARARELSGQAEATAISARGKAEAEAIEARGLAEAAALEKRGDALAEHGQFIINNRIAEDLPEIARAVAEPIASAGNIVLLDGPEGLSKTVVGAIAAAGAAVNQAKGLAEPRPLKSLDEPAPASSEATPPTSQAAGEGPGFGSLTEGVSERLAAERAQQAARRPEQAQIISDDDQEWGHLGEDDLPRRLEYLIGKLDLEHPIATAKSIAASPQAQEFLRLVANSPQRQQLLDELDLEDWQRTALGTLLDRYQD